MIESISPLKNSTSCSFLTEETSLLSETSRSYDEENGVWKHCLVKEKGMYDIKKLKKCSDRFTWEKRPSKIWKLVESYYYLFVFLCHLLIQRFNFVEGTIGMFGGISIAVNSLTGPAMLSLPATFQRSWLIPTIMVLLLVCFLSSSSSSLMANIISSVPGNENFQREVRPNKRFLFQIDFFLLNYTWNTLPILL